MPKTSPDQARALLSKPLSDLLWSEAVALVDAGLARFRWHKGLVMDAQKLRKKGQPPRWGRRWRGRWVPGRRSEDRYLWPQDIGRDVSFPDRKP